jgi:hypothetical protein
MLLSSLIRVVASSFICAPARPGTSPQAAEGKIIKKRATVDTNIERLIIQREMCVGWAAVKPIKRLRGLSLFVS